LIAACYDFSAAPVHRGDLGVGGGEERYAMKKLVDGRILGAIALGAALVGCSPTDADLTPDADQREALTCDGVWLPYISFSFVDDATGDAYCGPATVAYMVVSEYDPASGDGPASGIMGCVCRDGRMRSESTSFGDAWCWINPPRGETSRLTVTVPGYQVFETDISLAWACPSVHPVEARLVRDAP
jgi:hypothetical protein